MNLVEAMAEAMDDLRIDNNHGRDDAPPVLPPVPNLREDVPGNGDGGGVGDDDDQVGELPGVRAAASGMELSAIADEASSTSPKHDEVATAPGFERTDGGTGVRARRNDDDDVDDGFTFVEAAAAYEEQVSKEIAAASELTASGAGVGAGSSAAVATATAAEGRGGRRRAGRVADRIKASRGSSSSRSSSSSRNIKDDHNRDTLSGAAEDKGTSGGGSEKDEGKGKDRMEAEMTTCEVEAAPLSTFQEPGRRSAIVPRECDDTEQAAPGEPAAEEADAAGRRGIAKYSGDPGREVVLHQRNPSVSMEAFASGSIASSSTSDSVAATAEAQKGAPDAVNAHETDIARPCGAAGSGSSADDADAVAAGIRPSTDAEERPSAVAEGPGPTAEATDTPRLAGEEDTVGAQAVPAPAAPGIAGVPAPPAEAVAAGGGAEPAIGGGGGGGMDDEENEDLEDGFLDGDLDVHMAVDELLGIRGPVTMLLRNVLWLLAFHGAYLGLFAFFPFSIGARFVGCRDFFLCQC